MSPPSYLLLYPAILKKSLLPISAPPCLLYRFQLFNLYAAEANRSKALLFNLLGTKQPSNWGEILIMYALNCESNFSGFDFVLTKKYCLSESLFSIFAKTLAFPKISFRNSFGRVQNTRPKAFFFDKLILFIGWLKQNARC
jgi:hypothetical protein